MLRGGLWCTQDVETELNVKLTMVLFALPYCNGTLQFISVVHSLSLIDVEDGVLPVSVWSIWGCTEGDLFLEIFKLAIEPCDNSAKC